MFKGCQNIVAGIIAAVFVGLAGVGGLLGLPQPLLLGILLAGGGLALAPRMVLEWEKGVLLRLGKFHEILEPGITWIVPGVDMISS